MLQSLSQLNVVNALCHSVLASMHINYGALSWKLVDTFDDGCGQVNGMPLHRLVLLGAFLYDLT